MKAFTSPPLALRKGKLDNLALVPGSLLPFKKEWQQLANSPPEGSTLIILPASDTRQRQTLEKVATNPVRALGLLLNLADQETASAGRPPGRDIRTAWVQKRHRC